MITFVKSLSQDHLINSYNVNTVKFKTDTAPSVSLYAEVIIGSDTFTIYPDPSEEFYFSFEDIFPALINASRFIDNVFPNIVGSGYVYLDNTLYLEQQIDYKIYLEGVQDPEELSQTYKLVKSVEQPFNYSDQLVDTTSDKLNLRSYYTDQKNYHAVTYFEGHPFDLPIYSNAAQQVNILNETNSSEMDVNLSVGINRVVICDGDTDSTIQGDLLLQTGLNKIKISVSGYEIVLILKKEEADCAPFFKFATNKGAFGYFRANRQYEKIVKTKTLANLQLLHQDIAEEVRNLLSLGKSAENTFRFAFTRITHDEMLQLQDIFESPRVDMFTKTQFQGLTTQFSWIGISIMDKSFRIYDSEKKLYEMTMDAKIQMKTLHL